MEIVTNRELFDKEPAAYLERVIKEYVGSHPDNQLPFFGGTRIFDEPIVGFADGDDPLFQQYKTIIGDFHWTPREALETYLRSKRIETHPSRISVVSWGLPLTPDIRLVQRRETVTSALKWNHARWWGAGFYDNMARYLVLLLESLGYQGVAPDLTASWTTKQLPTGRHQTGRKDTLPMPPVWVLSV